MTKTRCLLVDDEPLALDIIESYILRFDNLEIVARCENALDAMTILRTQSIDLLFLDIQMPKLTGLDFLKALKSPPKTILTTAFREYAIESYELDVIDYLLKPIPFERFVKAINKYYQLTDTLLAHTTEANIVVQHDTEPVILVKGNRKIHRIAIASIVLIESMEDYVKIHVSNDKSIVVKQQIGVLEESLPADQFVRIHRSFIVAIKHIEGFTSSTVELGTRELPIGRNYKANLFAKMGYDE